MYKTGVVKVVKKHLFYPDINCGVRNCQNSCPQTSHVVVESKNNILSVMSHWKWSLYHIDFLC